MPYKLTPLNAGSGLLTGYAIYYAINPGAEGWGILISIFCVPVIIISLIVDLIIQHFVKKYLVLTVIEAILITLFFIWLWNWQH